SSSASTFFNASVLLYACKLTACFCNRLMRAMSCWTFSFLLIWTSSSLNRSISSVLASIAAKCFASSNTSLREYILILFHLSCLVYKFAFERPRFCFRNFHVDDFTDDGLRPFEVDHFVLFRITG